MRDVYGSLNNGDACFWLIAAENSRDDACATTDARFGFCDEWCGSMVIELTYSVHELGFSGSGPSSRFITKSYVAVDDVYVVR